MITLLVVLSVLLLLAVLALPFGADSRDSLDWQPEDEAHPQRQIPAQVS